jgi:FkbM family methyltransferase
MDVSIIRTVGYVARHLRTPRGRTRLARMLSNHAPTRDVVYRDQWGFHRMARLQDDMEALAFVGVSELPAEVAQKVQRGDWVIDVGANVGSLTAHFCHLVGPTGHVWAIEPVPYNIGRLEQLRDLNGVGYLTIFRGALSNSAGFVPLRLPQNGETGFASFTKSWDVGHVLEVQTWSLDELVADVEGQPAFVKIDVEGYEPQVLEGADRTLREMKPLVLCEFNDILLRDAGSSSEQLLEMFRQRGYSPSRLPPPLTGQVVDILLHPMRDEY